MVERWGRERQRRREGEDEEGREGERKKWSRHALTHNHSRVLLDTYSLSFAHHLSRAPTKAHERSSPHRSRTAFSLSNKAYTPTRLKLPALSLPLSTTHPLSLPYTHSPPHTYRCGCGPAGPHHRPGKCGTCHWGTHTHAHIDTINEEPAVEGD